jgi:hypothetical protein
MICDYLRSILLIKWGGSKLVVADYDIRDSEGLSTLRGYDSLLTQHIVQGSGANFAACFTQPYERRRITMPLIQWYLKIV